MEIHCLYRSCSHFYSPFLCSCEHCFSTQFLVCILLSLLAMRIFTSLIILISSISLWLITHDIYADCDINSQSSASEYLKWCAGSGWPDNAINPSQWWGGSTAIKALITSISKNVISFWALFAIGAIVFSGIQYTTSYWDDEKVKKAKTTGIYALMGLFLLLLAFPLVDIMVNFVYSFWGA